VRSSDVASRIGLTFTRWRGRSLLVQQGISLPRITSSAISPCLPFLTFRPGFAGYIDYMRPFLLFVSLLLIRFDVSSQNYYGYKNPGLTELDTKNGFKDFHLGDAESKYSGELSHIDVYNYRYTGLLSTAFSIPIKEMHLRFNKSDKLVKITLFLGEFEKVNLDHLISVASKSFGEPTSIYPNELMGTGLNENEQYLWKGDKVLFGILIKSLPAFPLKFKVSLIFEDKSVSKSEQTDY
jgi:hypothetical protein